MVLQTNLDVNAVLIDIARQRDAHMAEGQALLALHARPPAVDGSSTLVRLRHWACNRVRREWLPPVSPRSARGAIGTAA
ncbi:MAG: hypothetical protein U0031_03560 [Thermomicrobiales bacterium]